MKKQCEVDALTVTIDERINLGGLPTGVNRNERVLQNFDGIDPGHSLLVIDDFKLDWLKELLTKERSDCFDKDFFHIHREAGRHEACIKKLAKETIG